MGQVYILRLRKKKWYVGYTERSVTRVLEHAEKKGAKWTKKYPPLKNYLYWMSSPDHTLEDEDRITLSLMAEHGIKNVRGGSWCMVNMQPSTLKELNSLIKKSTHKKGQICERCGRDSHTRAKCYAGTTIDGVKITTKSWKYRPIKQSKPKQKPQSKKSSQTKSKTKKKTPKKKHDPTILCARCNRIGHASSDCLARTVERDVGPFGKINQYSKKGLTRK